MLDHKNHIAALDIGTNSFHMVIAEVFEDGSFKVVKREREILRLSTERQDGTSFIEESKFKFAAILLNSFKETADKYNSFFRVVATSAIREAENKKDFLNFIRNKTEITIEVIDGLYEADLIYKGISGSLPIYEKRTLCIDIGGGSTELIVGEKGKTLFVKSMKLGAVRLTQMFFPKFELSVEKIERCKTYINAIIKSVANDILKTGFELCAGTSGSFRSVISILQKQEYDFNASYNNESFSFNELAEVADHILVRRTKNDRMQIIGMEPRRADIIPAGVLILKSIFEQLHIKKVIYSDFALREGVLIDTIQRLKTIEPFVND